MKHLSSTVARLECGDQQASAFFVTPTLAVTASHSLIDHYENPQVPILLHLPGMSTPAAAELNNICPPDSEDIAFLRLSEPITPERVLPLRAEHLSRGVRWSTYGFPLARDSDGAFLQGSVAGSPTSRNVPRDTDLTCDQFRDFSDYRGFSGAPVFKDGQVVAVLLEAIDGGLTAISIFKLRQHFDSAGINYTSAQSIGDAPKWLHPELENASPNLRTFEELEGTVHGERSGYILLTGSPGSGKTLISGGFLASDKRTKVLGRYFCEVKVDAEGIALPPHYYRDAGTFAEWLAGETALVSTDAVPFAGAKDLRDFTRVVHGNLTALAKECRARSLVGLLIIDDPLPSTGISPTSLLHALPLTPPPGVRIVLTVSSDEIVRRSVPDLEIAHTTKVLPLEPYDCEIIVRKRLRDVPATLILDISKASGGNPLILSILVREVKLTQDAGGSVSPELLSFTSSNVEDFYTRQWRRIASSGAAVWLLGIIARLRGPLPVEALPAILPPATRVEFATTWASIQHLLHDNTRAVSFYHISFRDFVLRQTQVQAEVFHDALAGFCLSAPSQDYARMNVVFHSLEGTEQSRRKAAFLCTQEWADENAILCVPSAYILSDVANVLEREVHKGNFVETVRLLLLYSRIQFRSDTLFSEFVPALSFVVLALRGPEAALRLILERPQLPQDTGVIVQLLRRLVLENNRDMAIRLFHALRRRWVGKRETRTWNINDFLEYVEIVGICFSVLGPSAHAEVEASMRLLRALISANAHLGTETQLLRAKAIALPCAECLFTLGNFTFAEFDSPQERCAILAFILAQTEYLEARYPQYSVAASGSTGSTDASVSAPSTNLSAPIGPETTGLPSAGDSGSGAASEEQEAALDMESGAQAEGPEEQPEKRPGAPRFIRLNHAQALEELEQLYRSSGVTPGGESAVLHVLCVHSGDAALVERLVEETLESREISVRQTNGVDADLDAMRALYTAACMAGYTGKNAALDKLAKVTRHSWEKNFLSGIEWIGRTQGRWRSMRRAGVALPSVLPELTRDLFPLVFYRLSERAHWDQAYHIPETLLPFIASCLADLVREFEPGSAEEFVSLLAQRFDEQFGVFTEGFRRSLQQFAEKLRRPQIKPDVSRRLYCKLFDHIQKCVFNRVERVPELLQCAEGFASLGDKENAERVFRCAVESSHGPGWYKEDQFGLLLDTFEPHRDAELLKTHWRAAVEVLELASGELTFQRYVRSEKQRLIRYLSASGCHTEALALYRHYLHPSLALQRERITRTHADRYDNLMGSRFGAPEVDEQAACLALLEGFKEVSPLKRWALVELFVTGDDRHFQDFAQETCGLLTSEERARVSERFLRCLRVDFTSKKRSAFLKAIQDLDTRNEAKSAIAKALELGIVAVDDLVEPADDALGVPRRDNEPSDEASADMREFRLPGLFGGRESLRALEECKIEAAKRLAEGDEAAAMAAAQKGLLAVQADGWGMWSEMSPAWPLLCVLMRDVSDARSALRYLFPVILAERHSTRSQVARNLIRASLPALDDDTRRRLFQEASQHLQIMLAPERATVDVSHETNSLVVEDVRAAGDALDDLFVQLLGHPRTHMRHRAASAIRWLVAADAFDVGRLISRVVSPLVGYERELCAGILHCLALKSDPHLRLMLADESTLQRMLADQSFYVRYVAGELVRLGDRSERHLSSVADDHGDPPPSSSPYTGQVWDWRGDADEILECSPREDVRQISTKLLLDACSPHPPDEVRILWEIRCRGFGYSGQPAFSSPWEREAAFRAVGAVGEPGRLELLKECLMYNPLWPEGEIRLDKGPITPEILIRLQKEHYENAFERDGRLVLDCREIFYDPRIGRTRRFEIAAVLVSNLFFDGQVDEAKLIERRSLYEPALQELAPSLLASLNEPAVVRYRDRLRAGGSFTPSLPTTDLLRASRLGVDAFESVVWQNGRVWEPWGIGPVLEQGCYTLMRDEGSLKLSGSAFVWVLVIDGSKTVIVDPSRGEVYGRNR